MPVTTTRGHRGILSSSCCTGNTAVPFTPFATQLLSLFEYLRRRRQSYFDCGALPQSARALGLLHLGLANLVRVLG